MSRPEKHFQNLPMHEQIERAMPVARQMLLGGIDSGRRAGDQTIIDHVAHVAKDPDLLKWWNGTQDEDVYGAWFDRLEAAQALGIAIGLLVQSSLFQKGGTK